MCVYVYKRVCFCLYVHIQMVTLLKDRFENENRLKNEDRFKSEIEWSLMRPFGK